MNNHKQIKLIIINITAIVLILIIIEFASYLSLCFKYKEDIINYKNISKNTMGGGINKKPSPFIGYAKVTTPDKQNLTSDFRPIEYKKTNKKPIILFGCSYTYGFGLNRNETFSKKLSDYTNRTVINRGRSGTGIPFMYYQLKDKEILNELPKNAEYIIFTMIPDHIPRLFRYRNWVMTGDHTLRYKIKNNELIQDKLLFPFIHSFFTSIVIEEFIAKKSAENQKIRNNLLTKLISESYKEIKNNFSNAKMVILYYPCPLDQENIYNNEINNLKKENNDIIFIDINKELPNLNKEDKYWIEDNSHPSSEAWDIIVPFLSKKLEL